MNKINPKDSGRFIPHPKYIEALTEDEWNLDYEDSEFENIDKYIEMKERCKYVKKIVK